MSESHVNHSKARKRPVNKDEWRRNVAKRLRYSAHSLPEQPQCNHKTGCFKCCQLTRIQVLQFYKQFYTNSNKLAQDCFILKYCKLMPISRKRPRKNIYEGKKFHTKFYVATEEKDKMVPVCQKTFINILLITRARIERIMKNFYNTGSIMEETRGGDHTSDKFIAKRNEINKFVSSHARFSLCRLCASVTSTRYLPSELNITKLAKMYNNNVSEELRVKDSYFRLTFNTKFKLRFGPPKDDVCFDCSKNPEKIKTEYN